MAQRRFIRIILYLVWQLSSQAMAGTSWLPEEGEYFLGAGFAKNVSYTKNVQIEAEKYAKLTTSINELELEKSAIISNSRLTIYIRQSRAEVIDKLIAAIETRREKLKKDFFKKSQNFYLERGINQNYSFGINANMGTSAGFVDSSKNFFDLNMFIKHRIYENKKWMVSGEFGAQIEEHKNRINPTFHLNGAFTKKHKNGVKHITEMRIGSLLEYVDSNFVAQVSESILFTSGYSIQISSFYKYNKKLNYGYRYFFRDQLTVAKEIRGDIIPLPGKTTISFGLYQDYFRKTRKQTGNGFYLGIWIRI